MLVLWSWEGIPVKAACREPGRLPIRGDEGGALLGLRGRGESVSVKQGVASLSGT